MYIYRIRICVETNNKMKILQSFIIVALISFFVCIYFMKYILLYQYLTHDDTDTNNITISNGNNAENNTVSSPAIKSPISFLLGNFLYAYIIIIIFICICALYKFAATQVEKLSNGECQRQCIRRGCDIENGEISDKETELVPKSIPLQILPEISESNVPNYHCTWVGDWNKY